MFTTIVFLVVFALFGACVAGIIFWSGLWRLIPIGLGIVIIVAAILWAPKYVKPATVEAVYPPTTELAPVPVTLICPAPVVECTQTTPVVTEVPTEIATPIPTEVQIVEPPYDVVIEGCPAGSLGVHPNTGEPLIYKANPYPGVVCEFELYYNAQIAKVSFPVDQGVIVEDWTVSCPTGAPCEGVWYQTETTYVPAVVLTHYWVFVNGNAAETRFPSHACEYVAKTDKGHSNANIRVPNWALDSGSIFDHPGCPLPTS